MEHNIQFIREVCIKDNPSILDLVFGCEVSVHAPQYGESNESGSSEYSPEVNIRGFVTHDEYLEVNRDRVGDILVKHIVEGYLSEDYEGLSCHIIGRPIRLADVLFTCEEYFFSLTNAQINEENHLLFFDRVGNAVAQSWNLLEDNLEKHSKETREFIYNLLSK